MKRINLFMFLLAGLLFAFTACEDREEIIYAGQESDQALISFSRETYNLEIEIDDEGTLNIPVNSSAVRNTDRTYDVVIVEGETNTTADPSTYDVPETVTIPAGEYTGTLTIQGFDNDVETTPELLTIRLEGIEEDASTTFTTAVISVYQVCPIPSDYLVGEYMIQDAQATIGPGNGSENFANSVVNIQPGETGTTRTFTVTVLPGIVGASVDVNLSLICGEFVLQEVDPGIFCGENPDPPYLYAGASVGGFINSTYDLNSDDQFTVIYTEDPEGSCGGPFQSSFTLTKITE
ncbi:hypothetical protein [Mesonia aquimarina]|uniref:hypothetical protein n=1 Tax=Mesonia aquimarina TaxID=1504967 RepID=UPI0013CECA3B|nr:hypothetical protein [Mesonia aquimarina]